MELKSKTEQASKISRHCPVSGLSIFQKPDWVDIKWGSDYKVTVSIIGSCILWVKTTGFTTFHDVSRFIQFSGEVLADAGLEGRPYILINDWSELRGSSKAARNHYIDFIKKTENLSGVIFYGVSPIFKIGINLATRFKVFPNEIGLVSDYTEAIKLARQMQNKIGRPEVNLQVKEAAAKPEIIAEATPQKVLANPDWELQYPNFTLRFEVADDSILHCIASGRPLESNIEAGVRLQERIINTMGLTDKGWYFVMNLKNITGLGQKSRKVYIQLLLNLYQKYPFQILIFYGASRLLKAAINMTRPFISFRVIVVEDWNAALQAVAKDKAGLLETPVKASAPDQASGASGLVQHYVRDMLSFLEKIDWEENGLADDRKFDPSHPFAPVFEAIELIKWEFDDLLEASVREKEEKMELETKLQQAKKMEAIGTLAGGVAHDLNNVLSGIVGYPELLLLNLPEDSHLIKPLLTIKQAGEKAAAIVQDLLTMARRGTTETKIINLNQIITDYLNSPEFLRLRSYHPEVQVKTNLDDDLMNIQGSQVHLSKTVMNLVSNAAEAMPEGGTIVISTANRYIDQPFSGNDEIPEGDYVTVAISDTGVGIASEDLDRIFEPFYTKKIMGRSGTGLGMSVVWGTVKDHLGHIDTKSAQDAGTVFTLYFPATREALASEDARISMADLRGSGQSILIVDDVPEQRTIASAMLTQLGYSVTAVDGGEAAVAFLQQNSCDLVILDMIMDPGIDGLETYKRITAIKPGQKAVIASGFSETERTKMAQKLGAGTYIKKPYTLEKIGLAVKKELEKPVG